MRRPSVSASATVLFDDFAPRTFSSSRMTLAGLKKWVPITLSGRFVAAAISSTSRVEVFVARTASGLARPSSFANTSFLTGISSKTASLAPAAGRRLVVLADDAEATVERFLVHLDDGDRDADVGEVHRDAAAHGAGADPRRLLDVPD